MNPLSPANFDSAYTGMIAGAIPLHAGDIDKTVFMLAQDVLATPKLHLLIATDTDAAMCITSLHRLPVLRRYRYSKHRLPPRCQPIHSIRAMASIFCTA